MGGRLALGVRRGFWWERGAIAAAVAALHLAAFLGLLILHVVDVPRPAPTPPSMSYVTVPLIPPVKPVRSKGARKGRAGPVVYFMPDALLSPRPNAITVPAIQDYVERHPTERRRCPLILRPDSAEWKELCAPKKGDAEPDEEEFDDAAIARNAAIFARMEAELHKRHQPPKVPCAYTKKFEDPGGGPHESSAAMADIGCAVDQLFGR